MVALVPLLRAYTKERWIHPHSSTANSNTTPSFWMCDIPFYKDTIEGVKEVIEENTHETDEIKRSVAQCHHKSPSQCESCKTLHCGEGRALSIPFS